MLRQQMEEEKKRRSAELEWQMQDELKSRKELLRKQAEEEQQRIDAFREETTAPCRRPNALP